MIYQCPDNHHISNKKGRCPAPKCGKWLLSRKMTQEEVVKETQERQQQANR